MPTTWIIPEISAPFTDSFSKILLDYIYNNWSINTGNLAKPATMTGQNNKIEFNNFISNDN